MGGTNNLDFSFSWVKLRLHTEFQPPIMPVSGPKVCGGGGWWWVVVVCTPISVVSFDQAEQKWYVLILKSSYTFKMDIYLICTNHFICFGQIGFELKIDSILRKLAIISYKNKLS